MSLTTTIIYISTTNRPDAEFFRTAPSSLLIKFRHRLSDGLDVDQRHTPAVSIFSKHQHETGTSTTGRPLAHAVCEQRNATEMTKGESAAQWDPVSGSRAHGWGGSCPFLALWGLVSCPTGDMGDLPKRLSFHTRTSKPRCISCQILFPGF